MPHPRRVSASAPPEGRKEGEQRPATWVQRAVCKQRCTNKASSKRIGTSRPYRIRNRSPYQEDAAGKIRAHSSTGRAGTRGVDTEGFWAQCGTRIAEDLGTSSFRSHLSQLSVEGKLTGCVVAASLEIVAGGDDHKNVAAPAMAASPKGHGQMLEFKTLLQRALGSVVDYSAGHGRAMPGTITRRSRHPKRGRERESSSLVQYRRF
jgi:hypothetical protein